MTTGRVYPGSDATDMKIELSVIDQLRAEYHVSDGDLPTIVVQTSNELTAMAQSGCFMGSQSSWMTLRVSEGRQFSLVA